MKKNLIVGSLLLSLVVSNVVTAVQYKKDINMKDQELVKVESVINSQQDEINTYKDNIIKLNIKLKDKEKKIVNLKKKLEEVKTKNKNHNSP